MSSDDYTFANEPVKSPSGFRRDVSPLNALDGCKFNMSLALHQIWHSSKK
jgi:hypothetical protein